MTGGQPDGHIYLHAGSHRIPQCIGGEPMAVNILDDSMSSDRTTHSARLMPGRAHLWEVSWLPGHRLDRNRAITAMVLADLAGPGDLRPGDRQWIFAKGWADELGIRADDAIERISQPSKWSAAESQADREAGQ
jgi:hypothetical protein